MSSPHSGRSGYTESLATKMDRLADALSNEHTALQAGGVCVDVFADGRVKAVMIDDEVCPGGERLGTVITELINRAREQAQLQATDLVHEIQSDPRVANVIEQLGNAPERALPPSASAEDDWEYDDDPYRRKSRIRAD